MSKVAPNNCNAKFNTFLYAVILEQQSGVSLTVLSLLAQHNLDPWEEAAKYVQEPRRAAAARLSGLLREAMGDSCSAECIAAEGVRLLQLLPPASSFADPVAQNPVWRAIAGRLRRLGEASRIWIRNDRG